MKLVIRPGGREMVPVYERSLIFASFIGLGALVMGAVAYRSMSAPAPRISQVAVPVFNERLSVAPQRTDSTPPIAAAPSEAEVSAEVPLTATGPLRVTPVSVFKPQVERETLAMLPPSPPARESTSKKRSERKTAQVDICAKIGKRRVYYNKGKGQYWRCR